MSRERRIARSIAYAITKDGDTKKHLLSRILAAFAAFFYIFQLKFERFGNEFFYKLRTQVWQIDESSYEQSFGDGDGLDAKGDMGYSGSTFFGTKNGRFLIKAVPRRHEYSFFRTDFLQPYVEHMQAFPSSLLVRITDFLCWKTTSLGGLFGLAPTHHIVMENLLLGEAEGREAGGMEWRTYDLKPDDYFFPERDIAGGYLSTEATKDRLVDEFDGKIVLTQAEADDFLSQLEEDTMVLQKSNAVDYSLFLVRIPLEMPQNPFADQPDYDNAPRPPQEPPLAPPSPPTWRTGIKSADDKYVFRAVILDFFWAKHTMTPVIMTFLIRCWNVVAKQGPMSITTSPDEYRTRFLRMCNHIVEVKE